MSYVSTDVGSWSFVDSRVPVMSESMKEIIYEMNHTMYIELQI